MPHLVNQEGVYSRKRLTRCAPLMQLKKKKKEENPGNN